MSVHDEQQRRVSGDAKVVDRASVVENGHVFGQAVIAGDAQVGGSAIVCDHAQVTGSTRVGLCAFVDGSAVIRGNDELLTGLAGCYGWTTFREKDGKTILRFGCERHELRTWTKRFQAAKCRQHDRHAAEDLDRVVRVVREFWRGR